MTTIEELNKEIEVAKKHGLPDYDDEEDHAESCYRCSWLMGEGKGYPCLFQPKDEPAIMRGRR